MAGKDVFERYFHTMTQVIRCFAETERSEEILQLVVDQARQTMEVKAATLFIYKEDQDEWSAAAASGLSENYLEHGRSKVGLSLPDLVEQGQLYSPDITQDPRFEKHDIKKAEGVVSFLAVPVKLRGRAVGGLGLYTAEPRRFDPAEVQFIATLAEQGAMALERARLLEMLRTHTQIILEISRRLNSSLEIGQVLEVLTAGVVKALEVKAASVWLLDQTGGRLKLVASHGLSDEYLAGTPGEIEPGLAHTLRGRPALTSEAAGGGDSWFGPAEAREGVVAILSAPIMGKQEQLLGLLHLYTGLERDFQQDEIDLVSALAQQGGLAIENSAMYLMLENEMKSLEEEVWSHRSWF